MMHGQTQIKFVEKFKSYKSHDTDQIPTELIQACGRIVCFQMHEFINSIRCEEELPKQCSQWLCLFMRRMVKQIIRIIESWSHHC